MAARGVEGMMHSNRQLEQRAVGTTTTRRKTRTKTRTFFGRRMRKSLGRISATSSSSVSSPSFSERDRVLVVEQLKPAETLAATSGQRAENCIVQAPSSHLDAPPRPPPLVVASSTSLSITDPQIVSTILQAFALFAFGGFLSLSETALTTLWPWKIKELANEEGPSSPFYAVQQNVTRFLTTILIGSTVSSILATAMMTEAIVKVYGEKAIGLATIAMSAFVLLFCEIAPKSIAVQHALVVGRLVVTPIRMMSTILYPLGRICTAIVDFGFHLFRIQTSAEPFVSENELKLVLSGAMESNSIEASEQSMIRNVLDLSNTPAREVMTPLVQICGIESKATLENLKQLWREEKYTRVIVFDERVDNVVGIVNVLSIIESEDSKLDDTIETIMDKNVYFIPESMPVEKLLSEMLRRKYHIAVVVNEHGGTIGLVSLEDCIEEIVGEIYDEHDDDEWGENKADREDEFEENDARGKTLPRFVNEVVEEEVNGKDVIVDINVGGTNSGSSSSSDNNYNNNNNSGDSGTGRAYEVGAKADIEELAEYLEIDIPKSPLYETAGGWVCDIFARIPKEGETFSVSYPVVQGASVSTLALASSSSSSSSKLYVDYTDDSEEIDGFEGNADHKKSDFDLDDDYTSSSSSSSSSSNGGVPELVLRVAIVEADERRVSSIKISIGDENKKQEKREASKGINGSSNDRRGMSGISTSTKRQEPVSS
jgi:CBS domain containing-hemolysin-like protein